jgi:hypothetical protein
MAKPEYTSCPAFWNVFGDGIDVRKDLGYADGRAYCDATPTATRTYYKSDSWWPFAACPTATECAAAPASGADALKIATKTIGDVASILQPTPSPTPSPTPTKTTTTTTPPTTTPPTTKTLPKPTAAAPVHDYKADGFKLIPEGKHGCQVSLPAPTYVLRPDKTSRSYADADAFCKSHHARLCTPEEVKACVGRGTGMGTDLVKVWTNEPCSVNGKAGHTAVLGMGEYTPQKPRWEKGKLTECKTQGRTPVQCCAAPP